MSRESHLELKVGSFVLLAFVGLFFMVTSITDFSFMEKGYNVQAVFGFANGLKEAAPVRLAGVETGVVKELKIYVDDADSKKTKIRVTIWLNEGTQLPADSIVTINQLGLLGEKYVEITPGRSTEFIKPDSVLLGKDPMPMDKITEHVNTLAEKLEYTVDNINNGILSPKNQKALEGTLSSLNEIMDNVRQGKGTVGKLLMDNSLYTNLDELTADLKTNPWKLLYRPKSK